MYHRECYNRLTNINAIEKIVKRYEAAIQTASSNVISRTPGRPLSNQSNKLTEEAGFMPNRRSNVPIIDKKQLYHMPNSSREIAQSGIFTTRTKHAQSSGKAGR